MQGRFLPIAKPQCNRLVRILAKKFLIMQYAAASYSPVQPVGPDSGTPPAARPPQATATHHVNASPLLTGRALTQCGRRIRRKCGATRNVVMKYVHLFPEMRDAGGAGRRGADRHDKELAETTLHSIPTERPEPTEEASQWSSGSRPTSEPGGRRRRHSRRRRGAGPGDGRRFRYTSGPSDSVESRSAGRKRVENDFGIHFVCAWNHISILWTTGIDPHSRGVGEAERARRHWSPRRPLSEMTVLRVRRWAVRCQSAALQVIWSSAAESGFLPRPFLPETRPGRVDARGLQS